MGIFSSFLAGLFGGAPQVNSGVGRACIPAGWWQAENVVALWGSSAPNFNVVGEAQFQEEIASAIGVRWSDGVYWDVIAQLCFVEGNPADENAVGVFIEGKPVGYIPRDEAKSFRSEILAINPDEEPVICKAQIVGGFRDDREEWANYGVRLCLDRPLLRRRSSRRPR